MSDFGCCGFVDVAALARIRNDCEWCVSVVVYECAMCQFLTRFSLTGIKYLKSRRGKVIMMVNTFPFCEESKLRDKVIWRCTSKKTNCKARIHMLGSNVAERSTPYFEKVQASSYSSPARRFLLLVKGLYTEAYFLPSRAGKSVLIFRCNKFWVNNQYRDKLNWACRDKDSRGCLCRVQTTLNGKFVRVKGGHNHEPNFTPFNFDTPNEKCINEWNLVKST
ncbi:unnamed protein product [Leptidea sinapis]|uniref:FLYWCH-type domain-containing protein n=1 Tax=Leptidea sinapis TaxID=189913 RepID=A0A5E4PZK8_9NEOP|nr:unnamed protein product [Leptidea sinapis]